MSRLSESVWLRRQSYNLCGVLGAKRDSAGYILACPSTLVPTKTQQMGNSSQPWSPRRRALAGRAGVVARRGGDREHQKMTCPTSHERLLLFFLLVVKSLLDLLTQ